MKKIIVTLSILLGISAGVNAQNPCDTVPMITVSVSNDMPCLGESITLTASGASSYSWNNNVMNGQAFAPASSDSYVVISSYSNGCQDTTSVNIEVLELPDVIANASSLNVCLGDSILLNASNAASYDWMNPDIPNNSFYVPQDTGVNTFTVSGTGTNGCVNTSQVIVVVRPLPAVPTLNTNSISTCVDVAFEDQIVASASDARVLWFNDQALRESYSEVAELNVPNNAVGTQTYFASAFSTGCFGPAVQADVEVFARPVIDAGTDISIVAGESGNLNADAPSGSTVSWEPRGDLNSPSNLISSFTATNSETYTLTITDENSCVSTDAVTVNVQNVLTIANWVTPNGDGNNDVWKVFPEVVLSTCKVRVFDGFGRMMVETDNYQNDWDGTYEGETLPDGDYYYHIDCSDSEEKGTITLIH